MDALIASKLYSEELSDAKIVVGGDSTRTIPVHMFVLALRCPNFAALILPLLQQADGRLDLSIYPTESVECFLEHIYTFKTNIPKEPAAIGSGVMSLANLYGLPELKNACSVLFKTSLSAANACEKISECSKFGPNNMPEICLESLSQDPKTGLESASWNCLPVEVLAQLLASDNLFIEEVEIFRALLRWAQFQNRKVPSELLKLIRFPLMTPTQLSAVVGPSKLLSDGELYALLLFTSFPEPDKDTAGYSHRGRVPPILSEFKIYPPLGVVVKKKVVRYPMEITTEVFFATTLHIKNGGSLKCSSWDPVTKTGGTLVVVANSIVIDVGGSIDAEGCGWRGGAGNGDVNVPQMAFQGEGAQGPGGKSGEQRKGAGGAGQSYRNGTVGGGGGGYGTAGAKSSTNVYGEGGEVYGEDHLDRIFLGSGGGGGCLFSTPGAIPNGGNGGGALIIITHSLVCNGRIVANGNKGGDAAGILCASGGGGGSGGSIFIAAKELSGAGSISAIGGAGGLQGVSQGHPLAAGGQGGNGRIRIDALYRNQITSNPVFFDGNGQKVPSHLAKYR